MLRVRSRVGSSGVNPFEQQAHQHDEMDSHHHKISFLPITEYKISVPCLRSLRTEILETIARFKPLHRNSVVPGATPFSRLTKSVYGKDDLAEISEFWGAVKGDMRAST